MIRQDRGPGLWSGVFTYISLQIICSTNKKTTSKSKLIQDYCSSQQVPATKQDPGPLYLWPIPAYFLYLLPITSAFHRHFHQKLGICESTGVFGRNIHTEVFLELKTIFKSFYFSKEEFCSKRMGWVYKNGLCFDILPWYQAPRTIMWKVPINRAGLSLTKQQI